MAAPPTTMAAPPTTVLPGGGGAKPKKSLWGRAKKTGLLLGVIKQMEHDYVEYIQDASMLKQLIQLEEEVSSFWARLVEISQRHRASSSESSGIALETYQQMHLRITKSLMPDFDQEEAEHSLFEDWKADCGRKLLGDTAMESLVRQALVAGWDGESSREQWLTKHQHLASMFELCDLWSAENRSLAEFARALFGNIIWQKPPEGLWEFRPLETEVHLLVEIVNSNPEPGGTQQPAGQDSDTAESAVPGGADGAGSDGANSGGPAALDSAAALDSDASEVFQPTVAPSVVVVVGGADSPLDRRDFDGLAVQRTGRQQRETDQAIVGAVEEAAVEAEAEAAEVAEAEAAAAEAAAAEAAAAVDAAQTATAGAPPVSVAAAGRAVGLAASTSASASGAAAAAAALGEVDAAAVAVKTAVAVETAIAEAGRQATHSCQTSASGDEVPVVSNADRQQKQALTAHQEQQRRRRLSAGETAAEEAGVTPGELAEARLVCQRYHWLLLR